MKVLTCLLFFAITILALTNIVYGGNSTWGQIGFYDRIIARDHVEHAANWFSKHKEIVQYPPKGHENFKLLTAIRVTDHGGYKNFGSANLVKGGPGYYNATIEVRSQTRRPLNMTIEYFSRI
uniref:Putative salivary secreted peptide n=1 Tax=Haematobia irritans TaxID=7368 RepID=A0A1L8EBL4_HAEIR